MGDSISEGTVQSFVKQVGEYVEADEVVAVIETDKVNVDIRSTQSGVITKFFANEGDTVAVDSNFYEIDTEAKGGSAKPKAEDNKKEDKPHKKEEAAPKKSEEAPSRKVEEKAPSTPKAAEKK